MDRFSSFLSLIAVIAVMLVISVEGQISSPCSISMVSSFTPCLNFITGSTNNGGSPTPGCCDAVKSIMSGNVDCMCLIITGNVPLSLPINRTLAISLPKACKGSQIPLQCKASGIPLPAPGPILFGPTSSPVSPSGDISPSPSAASPLSPRASKASTVAPSPSENTSSEISPASPPADEVDQAPTANPGIRPVLTNPFSASTPSFIPTPYNLLVSIVIAMVLKCL